MGSITSFEDLDCWKLAAELRKEISDLVKSFPADEKYRLVDQMIRCSRSVTNNIAEGYGRFHFKENVRFCRNSRGSLYELKDHLIIAFEEGLITEDKLNELKEKVIDNLKILNGYINYLTRQASHGD